MSETTRPPTPTNASWPTRADRTNVPETSLLPGSEKAPPAALGMLDHAVQGAHDTIDRFADSAEPTVRHMGQSLSAAGDAIHAQANRLCFLRDDLAEKARTSVRSNPLIWVAGAITLGTVFGHLLGGRCGGRNSTH